MYTYIRTDICTYIQTYINTTHTNKTLHFCVNTQGLRACVCPC